MTEDIFTMNYPTKPIMLIMLLTLGLVLIFIMYTSLGYDFHIQSIDEMLRISKEIRISPIVDLDGNPTELTEHVIEHYKNIYDVKVVKTSYVFQKNGNQMLCIKK